jgi:glutamine amidotransferase
LYAGDMVEPRFYFVHSYHVVPRDIEAVTSTARHGSATVTASIQQNNILGVQFHPEKSHRYGLWLMANFLRMEAC